MLKLLISISLLITFSNAWNHEVRGEYTPLAKPAEGYCYKRYYSELNYYTYKATATDQYYCKNYVNNPNSNFIVSSTCYGPTKVGWDSPEPKGGDVDLVYKAWYFAHILCENVDMNIDGEGIEIIYIDGIPYNKTDIENALYFDPYTDTLVCKPTYLNINNMSCIQPDYDKRNIADAILKRDKIAREKNLTNVSGIDANNITYRDNGSIESFSFTATNSEGGIESIYTEFKETDPVFTVEDDGTIKETDYIPPIIDPGSETGGENGTGGIGGNTGGTGTNPGTGTGGNTGGTGTGDGSSDINYDQITTNYLYDIDNSLNSIKLAINPDLTNPTLDNPLEESDTYYDDYVIPQISELVTNLTNDFNNLKNTYVEKIDYIKENGFEFDYKSTLYETCPMNFKLNPFKDSENKDLKEEELALNIDICSLMANASLPDSEITMLYLFHTIFYTFFYTVILLGIFKFATLIFRSF